MNELDIAELITQAISEYMENRKVEGWKYDTSEFDDDRLTLYFCREENDSTLGVDLDIQTYMDWVDTLTIHGYGGR